MYVCMYVYLKPSYVQRVLISRNFVYVCILFICRLPIETAAGSAVYAEASIKGKKKEAVVECALNACRMLDAQDMLRHHVKGDYNC